MRISEDKSDYRAYFLHFLLTHAERRESRCSDSQPRCVPWAIGIKWKRIAVKRYTALSQKALRLTAIKAERPHIKKHQVVISAACSDRDSFSYTAFSKIMSIPYDILSICSELRFLSFPESNSLCSHHMRKRSSDYKRTSLIYCGSKLLLAENHSASWSPERLMCCRCNNISPLHRIEITCEYLSSDKTSEMRHIDHEYSPMPVGDISHTMEIYLPWICRISGKEDKRLYLCCKSFDLVVVKKTSFLVDSV